MGNHIGEVILFEGVSLDTVEKGVGKVDCKNVPSLSLLPVAIPPCNAPLQLTPLREASISYPWNLGLTMGLDLARRMWCKRSNLRPPGKLHIFASSLGTLPPP